MRRLLSLCWLLVLASVPLQAQVGTQCPLKGKEITRQARDMLVQASNSPGQAQSNYQDALARLRLALKYDSADATAHLLASRAYIGLDDYAKADSMLERFTKLLPQESCRQVAARERQSAWAKAYNAGIRAYQAGDDSTALRQFERANLIDDDARSLNNAAVLYRKSGHSARAKRLYQRAMDIASEADHARAAAVNLAEILLSQEKADSAVAIHKAYLENHPDDVIVAYHLLTLLKNHDREDEADEFRTGWLKEHPGDSLALRDLDDLDFCQRAFKQAAEVPQMRDQITDLDPALRRCNSVREFILNAERYPRALDGVDPRDFLESRCEYGPEYVRSIQLCRKVISP